MKKNHLLNSQVLLIALVLSLFACDGKKKELSKIVVKEFFNAVKNDNKSEMIKLYPDIEKIEEYYKSDEINIKGAKVLEDKSVSVEVENNYTNGMGKKFSQKIILYLKPLDEEAKVYRIFDSKGMTNYEEKKTYQFAINIGCIDKSLDLTDQEINNKIKESGDIMVKMALELAKKLKEEIKIESWQWEAKRGYATGKAIVKNNSSYSVPNIKYLVTYYDGNNKEIVQDQGVINYDALEPGSSKSFTFYTNYVGAAKNAGIAVNFDTFFLLNYILDGKYNGTECGNLKQ